VIWRWLLIVYDCDLRGYFPLSSRLQLAHVNNVREKRQDFEQHWLNEYNLLQSEYCSIVNKNPEADCALKQVYKVLGDIVSLSGCTPSSVGESESWRSITGNAKQNRLNLCKVLHGKFLFSAPVGTYTVT
jgi:hypothetical protein